MERMRAQGVQNVCDPRKTNLTTLRSRFDVVYDTAVTLPVSLGLSLLNRAGVFLDLDPTPAKLLRALVSRKFKLVICSANADNLGHVASAAAKGRLRLPIGKIVPLREGAQLIGDLEAGRRIGGKGVIALASPCREPSSSVS